MAERRIAVVLFNLGGPDSQSAVRPFLFNLFFDPSIIRLPTPLRWIAAQIISRRRAPVAHEIYEKMGGRSPILPNTQEQAAALTRALGDLGHVKTFICMRYWQPMTHEVVKAVRDYAPDEVVLLPLYPQFSTTTTASSYRIWQEAAKKHGLTMPQKLICCYPTEPGFITALARATQAGLEEAARIAPQARPLVVFSAHGLPKKVVDDGDPYVAQVTASVRAVAAWLDLRESDWKTAFQSRVGPLEWVGPSTDDVIVQAAENDRAIVVVPVAFVSEHSETLVELDIEYRHLADARQAPAYIRVPTVGAQPDFIVGLSRLVRQALGKPEAVQDGMGQHFCADWSRCVCKAAE
jgi:ferrochelatase